MVWNLNSTCGFVYICEGDPWPSHRQTFAWPEAAGCWRLVLCAGNLHGHLLFQSQPLQPFHKPGTNIMSFTLVCSILWLLPPHSVSLSSPSPYRFQLRPTALCVLAQWCMMATASATIPWRNTLTLRSLLLTAVLKPVPHDWPMLLRTLCWTWRACWIRHSNPSCEDSKACFWLCGHYTAVLERTLG